MAGGVTQAADELLTALWRARLLVSQPDRDGPGVPARTIPASRPPWNANAAHAVYGIATAVRALEHDLRATVTQGTGRLTRGGSDANTDAAVKALTDLTPAIPEPEAKQIARQLTRWTTSLLRLPAMDEATVWRPIRMRDGDPRPPACPYCQTVNLRLADRSYMVMCFYRECPGDTDGRQPPFARLDVNRLTGNAILVWSDGLVEGG